MSSFEDTSTESETLSDDTGREHHRDTAPRNRYRNVDMDIRTGHCTCRSHPWHQEPGGEQESKSDIAAATVVDTPSFQVQKHKESFRKHILSCDAICSRVMEKVVKRLNLYPSIHAICSRVNKCLKKCFWIFFQVRCVCELFLNLGVTLHTCGHNIETTQTISFTIQSTEHTTTAAV